MMGLGGIVTGAKAQEFEILYSQDHFEIFSTQIFGVKDYGNYKTQGSIVKPAFWPYSHLPSQIYPSIIPLGLLPRPT